MGRLDDLHARVFVAIHGQKQRLNTQEEIATWVAAQGVDKAKFLEYYNAFGVGGKVQRARQLTEAYQIDGVPAMGVAGRYFTSGSIAQSMERVLAVVEHLVEVSRKG